MKNLDNRIWITSRTRMISERKALRNQNVSYLTVTYFSLFTIVGGIFFDFYSYHYAYLDKILLSASVIVLVASLVAGGFRFETKASVFRECYLRLQQLEGEEFPPNEKSQKYSDLLSGYPNHNSNDYHDLIINHTYWEGKVLESGGENILATKSIWASYLVRKLTFYFTLMVLYVAPIIFLLIPLIK